MPPPRACSAEPDLAPTAIATPELMAEAIAAFISAHPEGVVLESGKVAFELAQARHSVTAEHGRCVLHLWSTDRNLVRTVVAVARKGSSLRLSTSRLGHAQNKLLELSAGRERRTPAARETVRTRFVTLLSRVLERNFPEWKPEGFRSAMDIERSFGPAYARGSLVRGTQAWAVIAVNAGETAATIDRVLTPGILWLHHCREHAGGRRVYQGLKVIVPRGGALVTQARMAWLNKEAAQWELYELDPESEQLTERDPSDLGNVRTRLVQHPDESAARERFAEAITHVMSVVPAGEHARVDQHLRSPAELGFLLHGLEFARARVKLAGNSFRQEVEVTFGQGPEEQPLTNATRPLVSERVHELFTRRRAHTRSFDFSQPHPRRRIGEVRSEPAHSRLAGPSTTRPLLNPAQDPLFRTAPERWLESVLRRQIGALTRGLAAPRAGMQSRRHAADANDDDNIGNRADCSVQAAAGARADTRQIVPHLDPQFLYAQVPAIAGASDRGLLDLLGVTADGRLAVLELKAEEDLHFALQGLDYWIRVRHHHLAATDPNTGASEFQRLGYFNGVELAPLPPRLYLIAPALRIHPATEAVLRYLSRDVPWQLIALDEHWRERVRVVWRKSSR